MSDARADAWQNENAADEDAQLLWQATARADDLLERLSTGRPPGPALAAFLGYLREVVLTRVGETERRLSWRLHQTVRSDPNIARIHTNNLMIQDDIEALAAAADSPGQLDVERVVNVTRRLVTGLEEHLMLEAATLSGLPGGRHSNSSLWLAAAHWYPLTEGPVIDLNQLRSSQGEDAVLNRLANVHVGEHVELRGDTDPQPIRRRLQLRFPGRYSWSESRDDHGNWSVAVARRPVD